MQCHQCGATNEIGFRFCGTCGTPLSAPRITPDPNPRNSFKTCVILFAGAGCLGVVVLAVLGLFLFVLPSLFPSSPSNIPGSSLVTPTSDPGQAECVKSFNKPVPRGLHCIEYIAEANGGIDVTYENYQGGTEQGKSVASGRLYIFTASPGQYVYLSAQADSSTYVNCIIKVDGTVFKHSESRGKYTIATCSGFVPK